MSDQEHKWFWMADYCRNKGWNPCDSYWWNKAEQAYLEKDAK